MLADAATAAAGDLNILIVAVVAIFSSVTAPLLLATLNNRQMRKSKAEDYARQDKAAELLLNQQNEQARQVRLVAEEATQTARKLQAAQEATTARTEEVARVAAENADKTARKLDGIDAQAKRIHTLVNSDMTAARQSELDQTRAMVIVLKRVIGLAARRGEKPSLADVDALERTENRVEELELILADRLRQFRQVQADAEASGTDLDGEGPPEPGAST